MIKVAGKEPTVEPVRITPDYGKFVIEPLPHGYGTTIGNALRRILLSSVPGVAINTVRIDGVAHEFTSVAHVHEDMTELILNLKDVAFALRGDREALAEVHRTYTGRIEVEGKGEVTAADIVLTSEEIEIVNPELHIATLTSDAATLVMELSIEAGVGYTSADGHDAAETGLGVIPVDSMYTPVTRVNHQVEQTRVGDQIDLDRLVLEIWTNAAMDPATALSEAARILGEYLKLLGEVKADLDVSGAWRSSRPEGGSGDALEAKIEELDFSQRTYNALKKEHIDLIGELVRFSARSIKDIRNLGDKSLAEIQDKLSARGLSLAEDEG